MAEKPANENILDQLKNGIARFELVSSPVPSISASESRICPMPFFAASSHSFFARIGPPLGGGSPAMKKVEHYSVQRITGDGRCLFRALVKGMSFNKGISLNPSEERIDADDLRMAVKETICDGNKERKQYEEALIAITVDESLKRYCQRIARPDFWGGESELLVLSKLCKQPIIVYIPEHEIYLGGEIENMNRVEDVNVGYTLTDSFILCVEMKSKSFVSPRIVQLFEEIDNAHVLPELL